MQIKDFGALFANGNIREAWYRGVKVWPPETYTYVVDNYALKYSSGTSLQPTALNYAYLDARLRKYDWQGRLVEESTVQLTPHFYSGITYYSISNGRITFNRATYGKTVFETRNTDQFYGTYTTPDGVEHTSGQFNISLLGNSRTFHLVSASVSLSLSSSSVQCYDSGVMATPSLSRTYYYTYTSEDREDFTDNGGTASLYLNDSLVAQVQHNTAHSVEFGTNYNSLSERHFIVKVVYYTSYENRKECTQGADYLDPATSEIVSGTYRIAVTQSVNTVSAKGGEADYSIVADHDEIRRVYYHYGGGLYSHSTVGVSDNFSYTVNGTSDAKSRYYNYAHSTYRLTLSHYNMEKRGTGSDSISIVFSNAGSVGVTSSVSLNPENSKTTRQQTTGVSDLSPHTGYVSYRASQNPLQMVRTYTEVDTWTSGSTETRSGLTQVVSPQSATSGQSWASIYHNTRLDLTENTSSGPSHNRTVTVTATYDGFLAESDITQYGAPYNTEERRVNSDSIDPLSVSATSYGVRSAATYTINADKRINRWIDGVTEYGTWSRVYEGILISLATSSDVFTLTNGTQTGASVTTDSNGQVFVYPISANTSTTRRRCTIINNYDSSWDNYFFQEGAAAYINIQSTASTGSSAGSGTIPVSSNVDWSVSSNQSWLTVSKSGNNVAWSVAGNTGAERSATITVTGGGITKHCTFTQSSYTPPGHTFHIYNGFDIGSITLYKNGAYEYIIYSGEEDTFTYPLNTEIRIDASKPMDVMINGFTVASGVYSWTGHVADDWEYIDVFEH